MSITNGSITIEDGTKAAEEYAPARKVSVTLAFAYDVEGLDILSAAADIANAKVTELLGKTAKPKPATTASATVPVTEKKATKAKDKAPEKTKDDLAREAGLLEETPAPTDPKLATKKPDDDLSELLGDEAPKPITDAELSSAAQKKNATEKEKNTNWAPTKIRELVAEYAGAGKQIRDIPAEKRQEFLTKLDALK